MFQDGLHAAGGHVTTEDVLCRPLFDVDGVYFKDVQRVVHMDRFCSWKYLVYIESYGWSASLKYRLAFGPVLFQGEARSCSEDEHLPSI